MKISLRVAQHLRSLAKRRGLIADIEKYTGIERHTVAGLLNNSVKYVSMDALARISDYLIYRKLVDPAILPGALIGRDPEKFWELLAGCDRLDFCLGTRVSGEWPGADYVMSTDSRLQGVLLSKIAGYRSEWMAGADAAAAGAEDAGAAESRSQVRRRRFFPAFHLLPAPGRTVNAGAPDAEWTDVRAHAEQLYATLTYASDAEEPDAEAIEKASQASALIALGSVKVNPVVELMFATVFGAEPFTSEDGVARPSERSCPIMFRFRENDPQPPSCCGGLRLAAGAEAPEAGLYYDTGGKSWACCRCDTATSDAAFIFYTYRPNIAHVELACGGFSSRATHCLTEHLDQIFLKVDEPQFVSNEIHVGLYLIRFTFNAAGQDYGPFRDNRPFEHEVIPVPAKALAKRLAKRS